MKCLLCFHGLMSSNNDFIFLKKNLTQYYDYIHTPNYPGHGNSVDKFKWNTILKFAIEEYDKLRKTYDKIDILGYSLGGALAVYVSQYRVVNALILLAPAFYYINFENYKRSVFEKSSPYIQNKFTIKKIEYFLTFTRIIRRIKEKTRRISCPICILWGEDDFLVCRKSGFHLLQISTNKIKYFITLKNHHHYNIISSQKVVFYIENFLNKEMETGKNIKGEAYE